MIEPTTPAPTEGDPDPFSLIRQMQADFERRLVELQDLALATVNRLKADHDKALEELSELSRKANETIARQRLLLVELLEGCLQCQSHVNGPASRCFKCRKIAEELERGIG